MKSFFSKVDKIIKVSLPYTALLAVILGVVNLFLINKAQSDIEYTYSRVDEVEAAVNSINTDYDNSDVINLIRRSHNDIVDEINSAERKITSDIIIFGR